MNSVNQTVVKVAAFSTNVDKYGSISLIRQFFAVSECKCISYAKEGHVEFDYSLASQVSCHIHFIEILKYDKIYSICSVADGYFLFIDLDCEATQQKLDKILTYIKDTCSLEKKFFAIGLYKEHYKIDDTMSKEAVEDFLNQHLNNVFYAELRQDDAKELVRLVTAAFQELSDAKRAVKLESKAKKKHFDVDNSNSTCLIF